MGRTRKQTQSDQRIENQDSFENKISNLATVVESHTALLSSLKDLPDMVKSLSDTLLSKPQQIENSNEYQGDEELFVDYESQVEIDEGKLELDELLEMFKEEGDIEYGPKVTEKIAVGMETAVKRSLNKEVLEKLKGDLKVPENCRLISVPKVNSEIWTSLPNRARISDLKMQQSQKALSLGLISIAKIAENIAINSSKLPHELSSALLQNVKDGANIMGAGFQEMSARRRIELKPYIEQEFASICTVNQPPSEFLFGENLDEALKKSKATFSVVKKLNRDRQFRVKPYERPNQALNFHRPSQSSFFRGGRFRGQMNRGNRRGFRSRGRLL